MVTLRKEKFIFLLTIAICFISIAVLAYLTPMHSDDYGDALKKLNFKSIQGKYINWSGRLLADTLSPILASLRIETKAIVTAFASTLLFFSVSTIAPSSPNSFKNKTLVFLATYFIYWLFSPVIGEMLFWIVGSANYLWMPLVSIVFIQCTLLYIEKNEKIFFYGALLLAIPGGLSNEASTVATVVFIGLLLLQHIRNAPLRMKLSVLLFLCLIGFCVLVFSPGNTARMLAEGRGWENIPLLEKILRHYPLRLLKITRAMAPALVPALLMVLYLYKSKQGKKYIHYSIFFMIAGLSASIALSIAAPWIAHRGISSIFIFYLCAFSSALLGVLSSKINNKIKRSIHAMLLLCSFVFILKYILMSISYYYNTVQDTIRLENIQYAKNNNEKVANIPDFFITRMLKKRQETFDRFLGYNRVMALYYKIPRIEFITNIPFNYALIKTDSSAFKRFFPINRITNSPIPISLYFNANMLGSKKKTFILGLPRTSFHSADTLNIHATTSLGKRLSLTLTDGVGYDDFIYFGRENISDKGEITELSVESEGKVSFSLP